MKKILCAILASILLVGCTKTTTLSKSSIVTLDVNPSIKFELNDYDKVKAVTLTNQEAKDLLDDMELVDTDINVAVNAVLGSLVKGGYLNDDNNTVLLSIENDDETKKKALEDKLSFEIQNTLKDYNIQGATYAQNLCIDDHLDKLIKKYDISYGKAMMINKIMNESKDDNKSYVEEDLVKLNSQELILVYQAVQDTNQDRLVGNISTNKYISKEQVMSVVLEKLNIPYATDVEIEFDTDDGIMYYEVELKYNDHEYEMKLNAVTGELVTELDDHQDDDQEDDDQDEEESDDEDE